MKLLAFSVLITLMTLSYAHANPPAFKVGIELSSQIPVTHAVEFGLKDIGVQYVNYYVVASPGQDLPVKDINDGMMALCDKLGIDFSIACHHYDPPEDVVKEAVQHGKERYRGVVFDELEHCRLLNNYSPTPLADSSKFETLPQAYDETLNGYKKLKSKFEALGSPVTSTHIWPLMNSISAEAGFTVCPKICKELYSPVSLATGIGAAKQYGRDLWVDCDLWFWDLIPGHTPEEMKSNLLLAYWMGADLVYIEGAGFNLWPAGKQGTPFSLINQISPEVYQLTPHGEMLRWFIKDYLPSHPRTWTFRDIKPNIAIVRFEDTCHGQRYTTGFPDKLYGSDKLKSTPDTEAWFGIWNLITFGRTGKDGLSLFKDWVGPSGYQKGVRPELAASYLSRPAQSGMHSFFVPLNGAIVYDHTVGYDLLKDVPLIFLTGTEVSDSTMTAIRKCVDEGSVCVAWGPLAKKHGFKDWKSGVSVINSGKGRFVLTDDFSVTDVYNQINVLIGRPDEIRYRFSDKTLVLRKVTDNEVSVEVL